MISPGQNTKVFITRDLPGRAPQILRDAGCEVQVFGGKRPLDLIDLMHVAAGSDAMICLLSDKINKALLTGAPRCKVYANYAVGYDNMDVEAATAAGVALCNTPDVLTTATAEIAWALLFAAARRIGEGERMVRSGAFHGWAPDMLLGYEVSGKTLGIIGAGRIGAAMARRASGFEMRVLYTKRSGESSEMSKLGAQRVELEKLLHESDFISVHAPLNPSTRHLINADALQRMKRSAILINTARGPIVDEAALAEALGSGLIAGAGLDVYEREPAIEPRLLQLDNVVLAPHIGSATYEARTKMAELAAHNILDYFEGRVPRTCINAAYKIGINN